MHPLTSIYPGPGDPFYEKAVAIVGMSCRFSQAHTLQAFWELLREGKDTIAPIPAERWNMADYYDPSPSASNKTHQREASMLNNIHDFDPLFFSISPAEAIDMHPSQKLMLELVWEAIESSTIPFKKIQGHHVGVYVGNIWSDFEHYRKRKNAYVTPHSALGQSANIIANRVSFVHGFTGPSLVVDTGCSASLVALHLACRSLWEDNAEMALAGGINHLLDPDQYIVLSKFGALSAKGKCSAFDIEADGFVRGEGGGVLLLKKLSQAEKDGDRIYAIIRSTAVNNNGYNVNLPATSITAQKQVLSQAYGQAGIAPHEVHYVEAHGTGTRVGDPTEAKAIGEFFSQGRKGNKLHIGSVKTNIGHQEGAAGIAGLIKVVLSMQHKLLPASLHYKTPNPDIPFEALHLSVQSEASPWPVNNGESFKAGINSFGWGGTNAHAVIEEYKGDHFSRKASLPVPTRYCLPLSAKSATALKDYARAYMSMLKAASDDTFVEICTASAILKPAFGYRVLFTAKDKEELLTALENFIQDTGELIPHSQLTPDNENKIVMVFPGQGSQWLGMGRELFQHEPVFRTVIEACEQAFKPYTDWSLIKELHAGPETSRLGEINVIQPALCAIQIALAKLWMSWGIQPDTIVGHSMGEVAAAYIAGALTLDDAALIICTRSSLMDKVSGTGGGMLLTELSPAAAATWISEKYPMLTIAVCNSPKSTVLAGELHAINEMKTVLDEQGIFCRQVKVDVASHSSQMDPLKADLRKALQHIRPHSGTVPLFSTVRSKIISGEALDAGYWTDNLRNTVQFSAAMEYLMNKGHTVFIEVSPHPVLLQSINECAEHFKAKTNCVASVYREKPEQASIYINLGNLYEQGYDINWEQFYHTTKAPDVTLPNYPFQREHFAIEDRSNRITGKRINTHFPLLGETIQIADLNNTRYLEMRVSLELLPYLKDFLVNGAPVIPEAAYIEMVLQAAREFFGTDAPVITQLRFIRSVILLKDEATIIQLKLSEQNGNIVFKFFASIAQESGNAIWELIATGEAANRLQQETQTVKRIDPTALTALPATSYYEALNSLGRSYGGYFQGIQSIGKSDHSPEEIHFSIRAHTYIHESALRYRIHPALLDACFQPLYYAATENSGKQPGRIAFLTGIEEIEELGTINYTQALQGVATLQPTEAAGDQGITIAADIIICNYDGSPVLKIKGLKGKILDMQNAHTHYLGTFPAKEHHTQQKEQHFLQHLSSLSTDKEKLAALAQLLIRNIAQITKMSPDRIKPAMTFKGLGIDSLMAIQLRNQLEKSLHLKLSVSSFWSHPGISEYLLLLSDILEEQSGIRITDPSSGKSGEHVVRSTDWFIIPQPWADAKYRLFCFHDAGGDASLFQGWEQQLGDDIELVAVELPGRGKRLAETPYADINVLIQDIKPALLPMLDKPFLFFGHSMGGLLAFELTRELGKMHLPLPWKLFISAIPGIAGYSTLEVAHSLSEAEISRIFPHLDKGLLGDEELFGLLLKRLRADLLLLNNYRYIPQSQLHLPLIIIHGEEDHRVTRKQATEWRHETSSSTKVISRPGGHRYLEQDQIFLTALIQEEASTWITEGTTS